MPTNRHVMLCKELVGHASLAITQRYLTAFARSKALSTPPQPSGPWGIGGPDRLKTFMPDARDDQVEFDNGIVGRLGRRSSDPDQTFAIGPTRRTDGGREPIGAQAKEVAKTARTAVALRTKSAAEPVSPDQGVVLSSSRMVAGGTTHPVISREGLSFSSFGVTNFGSQYFSKSSISLYGFLPHLFFRSIKNGP
jgi:hypothetical protein